LIVISDIVKSYSSLLEASHFDSLKIGLSNLLYKVTVIPDDSLEEIDYKLRLKIRGAKLSLILKYYFEKRSETIPDYITDWRNSCLNDNEFSEIRRIWQDDIDQAG
jgi:hypothetical protein